MSEEMVSCQNLFLRLVFSRRKEEIAQFRYNTQAFASTYCENSCCIWDSTELFSKKPRYIHYSTGDVICSILLIYEVVNSILDL